MSTLSLPDWLSASSTLFDQPNEEPRNKAFAVQLGKLYGEILALETRILEEAHENAPNDENARDDGRIVVPGRRKHKQYVLPLPHNLYVVDMAIDWWRRCIICSSYLLWPVTWPPSVFGLTLFESFSKPFAMLHSLLSRVPHRYDTGQPSRHCTCARKHHKRGWNGYTPTRKIGHTQSG
jgi:hypothetical protein